MNWFKRLCAIISVFPQPWWSQKRIDEYWEGYWKPVVDEEVQRALDAEDNIKREEKDGL